MDSASLSSLLKRLCKVMWEANVTNPITYVTQISFLIFLKMLEEMEAERGDPNAIFKKVAIDGQDVDFAKLRWSTLTTDPDNDRMLRTLRDLLPRLTFHPDLSIAARALFEDAAIVIPDGVTLRRAVEIISPVHFLSEDADVKGDLFEILVNDLGSQKKAAQFRTPRHLIRVIVEMVNPQIGETMCDSAGGTGGFAIAVYEHILLANTSPQFVREVPAPYGQTVKRGLGDKLTPAQWEFLQKGTIHLFEGDKDIIRMAAMNAVLHGFDHSPIVRRDGIGGSEDKWDEVQFDCIVENPPFSGASQTPKRSLRVGKGDKYVLFLAAALRSLRQGGRAGVVLPSGILFGDTTAHIEVKKRLLAECDLQAVVTLPKGMFEPYTPTSTCFLIFKKTGRPTKNVWFYNILGDGSSLRKVRKFGPQFRNDFPDMLAKWPTQTTEDGCSWLVPVKKLIENNYNLSPSSLGLIEAEKAEHDEPEDILASVADKEQRILEILAEMRNIVLSEAEHAC
jgi:type I restriction enzyme M protein